MHAPRMIFVLAALSVAACARSTNEFVFLGESNVSGEDAAGEANLIVRNANAAGCEGVSVGGYAVATEDPPANVYGVPVLIDCPQGVVLLPNGSAQP